jgi:hypothetical protein
MKVAALILGLLGSLMVAPPLLLFGSLLLFGALCAFLVKPRAAVAAS